MGKSAILSVRILSDAKDAQKGMAETEKGIGKLADSAKKIAGGFMIAGAAAGAALTKGLFDAVDADSANRKLAGQLGLGAADAAAAGELSGRLYRDAYGGSLEEVNTAIAAVGSTLADMSANGGADVERLSKKAMDLAGTFGVDVTEAVSTAGALMKNGLAADGDEAMDLLVGSMQKMPAAMQAELLPVMDEYAKHFADLGISGKDSMGMMVNASADGAIGMDKMGDSLKELTIRATDMSKTTSGAYDLMGLDMAEMTAKMLGGGESASEAFGMIVAGLQEIQDPADQSAAAIALFGTPLEDLGTAGIPDFLGAIDPMGDAFDSVAGAADKLSETVNSGPGPALEAFKRQALGSLQDMGAKALPYIEPLLGALQRFLPILGPLAVAIAIAGAAMAIFNAILWANPITLIVMAVAALIAGMVVAYNNIGWFKDAVNFMGQVAAAVFGTIVDWISNAVTWLVNVIGQSQTFQAIIDLLGAVFTVLGTLAKIAWDLIVAGVTAAIDWVKSITTESETFQNIMNGLGEIGKRVFGAIDTAISNTIGWIKDAVNWFGSLFGAKDKANSVSVDGGGAGARSMIDPQAVAAPMMMRSFAAADPLALAYSAPGAASYGAYAASPASALTAATVGVLQAGRAAAAAPAPVTVNVTVKADATTDKVALGAELLKAINKSLAATGQKKLATR